MTIIGKFPSMNEYILKCRTAPIVGSQFKRKWETIAAKEIKVQLNGLHFEKPIKLHYRFYEENNRRDDDNVFSFFSKVFQDALVSTGTLIDDSRKYVKGFTADFSTDKVNPRIEIEIEVIDDE